MVEYIGDLKEYLAVQYAKSNRSTCRKCKQHIQKNHLRIGIVFDDEKFTTSNWFHLSCFEFKPRHKVIDLKRLKNYVDGLNELNKSDQRILMKTLTKGLEEFQEKEQKTEQKRKKLYQMQQKHRGEQKSSENTLPKNQQAEERKKQGKKLVRQTRKHILSDSHLSPGQKSQYEKLINQYKNYSVNQLKHILQTNGQVKIGRKDELAARCADGRQFGRIPPCPKCGGGKLKFDRQKGLYFCPGYMEDTDFVHCDGKFGFGDVKRTEWIE